MRKLFVGEDDNEVINQFENEKMREVDEDLGKEVPKQEIKRGWNEWAGSGVNEDKHVKKVERSENIRKQRIEDLKKQRADNKLRGVVLNTEDRDKKFASKYWVKDLPHPFKTVEQYKRAMDVPLGKEWTTLQSHKRLIQPEILTKAGEIIKPLRYLKDVAPKTLDTLVQHRLNKREKRPAAKF